jgi:hypothetical protein
LILSRVRWVSQERVDIPDALNVEAFGNADWAEFVQTFMVGTGSAYIVRGFTISTPAALIGTKTVQVSVNVASSMVFHPGSVGGAGAFYSATSSEPVQSVSLTPNQTNYIELDQTTTTGAKDTRVFWDPKGGVDKTGIAFSQDIDTVTYLGVTVSVNTVGFTAGKVPIVKIVVASDGTITSLTDCRQLFFRLGSGGLTPNDLAKFSWAPTDGADAGRAQRPDTITSAADLDPFNGSDKVIISLKGWMNAVMSSIAEIRGTDYWFTSGSSGGSLTELYQDSVGSFIKPQSATTLISNAAGTFTWSEYLDIQSTSGPYYFRIPASNVVLSDGDVAYVTQVRNRALNQNLTWFAGFTYVNGVAGTFTGLTSDSGASADANGRGTWIKKTSDGQEKYVRIVNFYDQPGGASGGGAATTAANAQSAEVAIAYGGTSETASAVYARGAYTLTKKALVDPTLLFDAEKYWVVVRYGTKVFVRDGRALADGEERIVNSSMPSDILTFMGAADVTDNDPNYAANITGAVQAPNWQTTNGESLTARLGKLTGAAASASQDKNVQLVGKQPSTAVANFVWNVGTSTLTWEQLYLASIGDDELRNQITDGSFVLADQDVVYVAMNRTAGVNATLTMTKTTASALDPTTLNDQTFIIARRIGSNVYTAPLMSFVGTSFAGAYFGDGSDGAITADGTTTIAALGAAPSSSIYTLTGDVNATNLTINTGVKIKVSGYRIFVSGLLTLTGTAAIHADGGNGGNGSGGGSTGGAAGAAGGALNTTDEILGNGGAGGVGSAGSGSFALGTTTTYSLGGNGGASADGGGTHAGATATKTSKKSFRNVIDAINPWANNAGVIVPIKGGAGGNGGGSTAAGQAAGGGGGGGGTVVVAANQISFSTTCAISANGGVGGNPEGSSAGAGGGGGGGAVWVIYRSLSGAGSISRVTATGGAAGTGGLAGTTAGSNGTVITIQAA